MATSSRVYEGGKIAPENYFDESQLDHIGVVEVWGFVLKTEVQGKKGFSCGVYFGPNSSYNLAEVFTSFESDWDYSQSAKLPEICATIVALQTILTSIIAKAELTKDIEIIILKIPSNYLISVMARAGKHRSRAPIWLWMELDFKRRSGQDVPVGWYWRILQELWLAVEERGVEIQMWNPDGNVKHNKALHLAVEANRTGRTSRFSFPLSASDILGFFNIPYSRSSSEERMVEEEGADDEETSGEKMGETDQDDKSEEGTDEEVADEE